MRFGFILHPKTRCVKHFVDFLYDVGYNVFMGGLYMKFSNKILCLVIAGALLLPYTAFAENNMEYRHGEVNYTLFSNDEFTEDEDNTSDTPDEEIILTENEAMLLKYLADKISDMETEIAIPQEYSVVRDRFLQICNKYLGRLLQYEYPEVFYFSQYSFSYSSQDDTVKIFSPVYEDIEETNAKKKLVSDEVNKIVSMADDMTDLEKALFVHDYIVSEYQYDTRANSSDDDLIMSASRTLPSMIEEKQGVCQGYTYLYMVVMNKLGVECITVPSDNPTDIRLAGHIWNKIKIDGEWYNVDLTYDDPCYTYCISDLTDKSSDVLHSFFLVTDEEIKALDTYSRMHDNMHTLKWDDITPAEISSSAAFSDLKIHDVCGGTVYSGGTFYCITPDNAVGTISVENNEITELNTEPANYCWYIYGSDRLYSNAKYNNIVLFDGKIYINSPNKVFEYDTSSGKLKEVYEYEGETDKSNTYFFGLRVRDGALYAEHCILTANIAEQTLDCSPVDNLIKVLPKDVIVTPPPEYPEFDELPCEKPQLAENEGTVTVTAEISDEVKEKAAASGKTIAVMAAEYDGDRFIGFKAMVFNEDNIASFTPSENCNEVKVFIWAGFIMPLSEAATLTLGGEEI